MRTRGFTLIELMISIALFGLVAAGALSLMMSAVRSQSHAARVDLAQSGLRASLDFITRDVVAAGAGAKAGTIMIDGNPTPPVQVLPESSTGPDTLDLYLVDATTDYATTLSATAAGAGTISVDSGTQFTVGKLIQLCDLSNAVLLRVTDASSTALTVTSAASFGTVASFPQGSYVFKSRHVTYAINSSLFAANVAGANGSVLTMDLHDSAGPQPLAEGIEDLQIALGFDKDDSGTIDERGLAAGDDEWFYNVAGETVPSDWWPKLKSVRVTIIATSTMEEPGMSNWRPKAEDHGPGSTDRFFRRAIRSEIAVRNLNL